MKSFSFFENPHTDHEERRKRLFFVIPATIGIPLACIIGLINVINGLYWLALFDIILAVVLASSLFTLRLLPQGKFIYRSSVFVTGFVFLYCIHMGGKDGSLIFWLFLMPLIAHFLLGKKEGLLWSAVTYIGAAVLLVAPTEITNAYVYATSVKIKFLMAYLFLIVLTYRYESAREEVQAAIAKERQKLADANSTLLHLKTAVEQSMDGMAIIDMDGHMKFINASWAAMHGAKVDQLMGEHVSCLHTATQYDDEVVPLVQAVLAQGRQEGEIGHLREDGTQFPCWMSASLLVDEHGHHQGVICVARDITERKAAEMALRASEARYRTLLEVTPDAVTVYDPQGNVVYVNPAFERQFGWPSHEVMGKPLDFVPPGEVERTKQALEQLRAGQSVLIETKRITKSGKLLDVQGSASKFKGKDGRIEGTVVITRDITERKQAEKALKEAKKTAEAASLAKSHFVANISHEIRTPMNGVIGMTGLLLDTDLAPRQREFAETIQTSAESLLSVINDVLDFSKIEADKLEIESINFDLRFTLEDTCDLLALKAQDKNLEFLCMVDPEVPSLLQGDPGRLRQILINMSNNAIKFTQEGEILVKVSLEDKDEERVYLHFSVTDTGIGIPKDRQYDLFAPFTQMDASTTREYGGTGLGLSICKRLVDLMGGEIGVISRPGEGSTFWFCLPFIRQSQAPEPMESVNIKGSRILVVDDNDTNRRLLAILLETWGCRFSEAPDANTALEKLREAATKEEDPYAITITDMQMPVMDGEELGKIIKNDPNIAPTKLVMMTSIANRGDAARLSGMGFSAYLTKPIKQSLLFDCLQTVLSGQGLEEDALSKPMLTRHTIAETKKRRYRLLLVEDNTVNRQVALNILANFGYRTEAVANGQEAIKALEDLPYDLVLMDCQMPVMDGYEATRRIRHSGSMVLNREIPIVAMTAHAMSGDKEKCIEAGMDDYISKPVNPRILNEVVEKWIRYSDPQPTAGQVFKRSSGAMPVFDKEGLFSRMLDDEDLVLDVLRAFLEDVPKQMRALRAALEGEDDALARLRAHTLAGASGNVGALLLREVALELEVASKEADFDKARSLSEDLSWQVREFVGELDKSGLLKKDGDSPG